LQGYIEFRADLPATTDRQAAIDALTTDHFPDANWLVVHARHTNAERDDYADDPGYYDPGTDGLLADPVFEHDGHTLSWEDIYIRYAGSNHTIPAGERAFDAPESDPRTVTLYATTDGTLAESGAVEVATVEIHPAKIVNVDAEQFTLPESEYSQAFVRGDPPTHFADESVAFPERLESKPVERQFISSDTEQAILNARDAGDTQAQIDHILDVLDVIDL